MLFYLAYTLYYITLEPVAGLTWGLFMGLPIVITATLFQQQVCVQEDTGRGPVRAGGLRGSCLASLDGRPPEQQQAPQEGAGGAHCLTCVLHSRISRSACWRPSQVPAAWKWALALNVFSW
jgi:hypothetical protein